MISATCTNASSTTTTGGWYVAVICPRCKGNHDLRECPQVKAIEYHEDGIRIKRVEFLTPGDYMPPVDNTPIPLEPVTIGVPVPITTSPHKPPYEGTITVADIGQEWTAPFDPNIRSYYE